MLGRPLLERLHEVFLFGWPGLSEPLQLARMLVLMALLFGFWTLLKQRNWLVAGCLFFPLLYYLDSAIVQSFPEVKRDTPTLLKMLTNLGWVGVLGWMYYALKRLPRLECEVADC